MSEIAIIPGDIFTVAHNNYGEYAVCIENEPFVEAARWLSIGGERGQGLNGLIAALTELRDQR